jgi:molecular chaperone GrpE
LADNLISGVENQRMRKDMEKKMNKIFTMNNKKKTEKKMKSETDNEENNTGEDQNEIITEDEEQKTDHKDKECKTTEPVDEKAELQIKVAELNDKFLRLYSEYDNFRKRTIKEKIELSKTASEDVIVSLLPVLDDFDRALKAMNETENIEGVKEGILLIYQKFKALLTQKGVEELKAAGEVFNTDFHEAVTNLPAETEDMKGKKGEKIQKEKPLNGREDVFWK